MKAKLQPPPELGGRRPQMEIVFIDNTTWAVEKRVAEEIKRLRDAVRLARRILKDLPETD